MILGAFSDWHGATRWRAACALLVLVVPLGLRAQATGAPHQAQNSAVERFAREWEERFAVKDYEPADPLAKELHAYFKRLYAELENAVAANPHDPAGAVSEVRQRLMEETKRMVAAFVAAGHPGAEAELYFDRLFPRLQRDLVRLATRESAVQPAPVQQENAEVSDGLMEKARKLHVVKKDLAGALQALEDALRFAPANVRVSLDLALAQQKFGRLQEARFNFDAARQHYPRVVNIYLAMGAIRGEARDYYGAIEDLTTAIYLNPRAIPAYTTRANARLELGDLQGAIDDFGIQIATGYPDGLAHVHYRRARAHYDLGNLSLALADTEAALRLDQQLAAAHYLLGIIRHRSGQWGAALTAANRAVELRPDIQSFLVSRLWLRHELGQAEAALADADRLRKMADAEAYPHYVRGSLLELLDKPEEAEGEYREAIRKARLDRDTNTWHYASFFLDLLLRKRGAPDLGYLADVLEWEDDWQKRVALHLAGRIPAASLIEGSRQASTPRRQINQECEAYYYAGMLHWLAGRRAEALELLKQAARPVGSANMEYRFACKILRDVQAGAE